MALTGLKIKVKALSHYVLGIAVRTIEGGSACWREETGSDKTVHTLLQSL